MCTQRRDEIMKTKEKFDIANRIFPVFNDLNQTIQEVSPVVEESRVIGKTKPSITDLLYDDDDDDDDDNQYNKKKKKKLKILKN